MGSYDTIKNYRQEKFTDRKAADNMSLSFKSKWNSLHSMIPFK